ncbi:hypothetical protein [Massilia sp. DD77]|uniref:hypothetical protein n=1 Tax=Massilia sp. DD77 TaxID=3109349 RepID=UPI002FFFA6A7
MRITAINRIARRLVRHLLKPLRLWLTECQIEKSRENVSYYESVRVYLAQREQEEVAHQAQLAARRMAIERGLA